MAKSNEKPKEILIPQIAVKEFPIHIVGTAALISNRKSEAVVAGIAKKEEKEPTRGRLVRAPEERYADSMYWLGKNGDLMRSDSDPAKHKYGFAFPARGFKKAAINACRSIKGSNLTMALAKNAFFVVPEYILLLNHDFKTFAQPRMRSDFLSLPGRRGSACMQYRGEFPEWACKLRIQYDSNAISMGQLINLFNYAGFGVGIGDDRPDKTGGIQGRFEIFQAKK